MPNTLEKSRYQTEEVATTRTNDGTLGTTDVV